MTAQSGRRNAAISALNFKDGFSAEWLCGAVDRSTPSPNQLDVRARLIRPLEADGN